MFTSDSERRQLRHLTRDYLIATLLCGVFSAIYEYFSHGVYSNYMVFLFLFPLLLGAIPFAILGWSPLPVPGKGARMVYHAGAITLGFGSCLSGILEIYGTTSPYLILYWAVGGAMVIGGVAAYLLGLRRRPTDCNPTENMLQ